MKKFKNYSKLIIYSVVFLTLNKVFAQDFYYAGNKKISLQKVTDKFVVLNNGASTSIHSTLISTGIGILDTKVLNSNKYVSVIQVINGTSVNSLRDKLATNQNVKATFSVFKTASGEEMGLTDQIVLKFKNGTSVGEQSELVAKQLLSLVSKNDFGSVYTVGYNKDALKIANLVFESGLVDYAHPDFLIEMKHNAFIPNDPYFTQQFSMHNVGQIFNDGHSGTADADVDAPEAWDITKGDPSIIIAVIDEGVTSNHPDLPNIRQVRLNGSNFAAPYDGTNANDPSPYGNGNHGNACAGIISATQGNSEGVTGIAPDCKIMPVRIPFGSIPSSVYAAAITFAKNNGAKILSNSWGYQSTNPNLLPDIVAAFQGAVDNGRIVLIAAGNTANVSSGNQGIVTFPGNIQVNTVITVGASDRYDKRANYSPLSNLSSSQNQIVDLVAPSHKAYSSQIPNESFEIWSMDIPGINGYNPWNETGYTIPAYGENLPSSGFNYQSYTGRMGGTSAATPLTAGIAALLLSINPGLTNQQVFDLLTCSADDVGGYTYTSGFSNEMGNGRVNAFNALMSMCINTVNITWPINTINGIKYQAGNNISINNTVSSGSIVSLKANNQIKLLPGTVLSMGSNVSAKVSPCTSCVQDAAKRVSMEETSPETLTEVFKPVSLGTYGIYPNPVTTGKLNFGRFVTSFTLKNSIGIIVLEGANSEHTDISSLSKGLYFLELDDKIEKIIIQ